jgi:hypothetical protein
MYYGTPPIVTSGLVLYLDSKNPQSIPLDPTVNNIRSQSGSMGATHGNAATMSVSWSAPDASWYVTFKSGSTATNYKGLTCVNNKNSPFVVLEPTSSNVVFSYKIQAVDYPISMSIDLNNGPWSGSSGNNNDNRSFETVSPAAFILITTSSAVNVVARYTVQTGSADFTGSYYYTFNNIYAVNNFPINQDTTVRIWDIQHELSTYQTSFTATSRSIWYDLSGNNNHATLAGVARPIPKYNYLDERVLNFDGTGSYASVLYNTNFNAVINGISLNTWVYNINPLGSWRAVIQRNRNGNTSAVYGIWRSAGNGWQFRLGGGGADSTIDIPNATTGRWVNLTLTYDKTTLIAYINGVNVGTNTPIGYVNDTQNLLIGDAGVNEYFKGGIASAQVYNRALSQAEILQNYNATKTRFGLT